MDEGDKVIKLFVVDMAKMLGWTKEPAENLSFWNLSRVLIDPLRGNVLWNSCAIIVLSCTEPVLIILFGIGLVNPLLFVLPAPRFSFWSVFPTECRLLCVSWAIWASTLRLEETNKSVLLTDVCSFPVYTPNLERNSSLTELGVVSNEKFCKNCSCEGRRFCP